MPTLEQGSHELKHLDQLRKLIATGKPFSIRFDGADWQGSVRFQNGMIDGTEASLLAIRNAVEHPVNIVAWEPAVTDLEMPVDPKIAFPRALTGLHLGKMRIILLKNTFSKLPAVRLKAAIVFRLNMEDFREYQALYKMGLAKEGIRMQEFLSVDDEVVLARRLKIIVACYCLGLFIPVQQVNTSTQQAAAVAASQLQKAGLAARIMGRLRSL